MLATIVIAYAVIIGLGDSIVGGPGRLLLLGYVLGTALGLRNGRWRRLRVAAWIATAAGLGAAIWGVTVSDRLASGIIGGTSLGLTAAIIVVAGMTILDSDGIDTAVVVGVLSVYLLLALLFASLNQLFAAFDPNGYLHGVSGLPNASDQLYFSVITMATVGYGDIVPASGIARAVAVVEALTGQLYLVSVVAAVVGGWRRQRP
jgi:hypothetical protein